jgi:hypothetical protein
MRYKTHVGKARVGIHTEFPSQTKRESEVLSASNSFAIQVAILRRMPGAVMVKKSPETSNPGNSESGLIVRWERLSRQARVGRRSQLIVNSHLMLNILTTKWTQMLSEIILRQLERRT